MSLKELYHNKWVRFGFWAVLYLAWVIWLGNYWWLLGLGVLFDAHITKKVKWLFWKKNYKEGEKKNAVLEWIDAIIFAVIVVTFINTFFFQAFKIPSSSMENTLYTGDHLFVSKLSYGPRMPHTPLTLPFTHNVMLHNPNVESYSELIKCDYKRLKGFGDVEVGDMVVFGFPHGDTVLTKAPAADYYELIRNNDRKLVINLLGPIKVRPYDKKDHYVKRCVAVAGDTLQIVNGQVYVNSQAQEVWPGVQNTYKVVTKGKPINTKILDDLGVRHIDVDSLGRRIPILYYNRRDSAYYDMPLTEEMIAELSSMSNVLSISQNVDVYSMDNSNQNLNIFPFSPNYKWTKDNLGPLWIPERGATVELTLSNLPLYSRIITSYEGNELEVKDGRIFINSQETQQYTFKQNYYFMMGDNRHNSLDSRYWGFVPEDHIVGKPVFIWWSADNTKSFPNNIRWSRLFNFV